MSYLVFCKIEGRLGAHIQPYTYRTKREAIEHADGCLTQRFVKVTEAFVTNKKTGAIVYHTKGE